MAKKVKNDDGFTSEAEMNDDDDFEAIDIIDSRLIINLDARRRLEQFMEDKALERLIDGGYSYYS